MPSQRRPPVPALRTCGGAHVPGRRGPSATGRGRGAPSAPGPCALQSDGPFPPAPEPGCWASRPCHFPGEGQGRCHHPSVSALPEVALPVEGSPCAQQMAGFPQISQGCPLPAAPAGWPAPKAAGYAGWPAGRCWGHTPRPQPGCLGRSFPTSYPCVQVSGGEGVAGMTTPTPTSCPPWPPQRPDGSQTGSASAPEQDGDREPPDTAGRGTWPGSCPPHAPCVDAPSPRTARPRLRGGLVWNVLCRTPGF